MISGIDYKELSEAGLMDLMLQKDPKALEEYNRRLNSVAKNVFSLEEFERLWGDWKFKRAQIEQSVDYTKLTVKQLRRLITIGVDKAMDEYDKRIQAGEIKLKGYPFEEFEKLWKEGKFGYIKKEI